MLFFELNHTSDKVLELAAEVVVAQFWPELICHIALSKVSVQLVIDRSHLLDGEKFSPEE